MKPTGLKNQWLRSLAAAAVIVLTLAPLSVLYYYIRLYYVDAPYSDEWEFVGYLDAWKQGQFKLTELFTQYNEHRIVFTKLSILSLSIWRQWDHLTGLHLNLLLAIAEFLLLLTCIHRAGSHLKDARLLACAPAVSVLFFSMRQSESWYWGFTNQIWFVLLMVSVMIYLLAVEGRRRSRTAVAIGCGIAASFSYGNGILAWPLGMAIIPVRQALDKRYNVWELGAWAICGLFVMIFFLHGYRFHVRSYDFSPIALLQYCLVCLSNPLLTEKNYGLAFLLSSLGLVAFPIVSWILVRKKHVPARLLLPFWAMAGFSIGTACLTAVGRLHMHIETAFFSRYVTFSTLFWVCLVVLIAISVRTPGDALGLGKLRLRKAAAVALLAGILFLGGLSSWQGRLAIREHYVRLAPAVALLKQGHSHALLELLSPHRATNFDRAIPLLQKHHLSTFKRIQSRTGRT